MKRKIVVAACAAGAIAVGIILAPPRIPGTEANRLALAKSAIASQLSDPQSAQFRGVRQVMSDGDKGKTPLVCGEVNGHNRLGAYAGFRRFFYEPASQWAMIEPSPNISDALALSEQASCERTGLSDVCERAKEMASELSDQAGFNGVWDSGCG